MEEERRGKGVAETQRGGESKNRENSNIQKVETERDYIYMNVRERE